MAIRRSNFGLLIFALYALKPDELNAGVISKNAKRRRSGKAEYDRISNSTVSCYQSYREGKYTKEEYVQLRKTNQELLADLENQISDLQEKVANQEPDAEEKIEQLTQYSMLEQYDGDVLSNIIDKVLIYNDKDIEVVFKGENFIRNAV